MSTLGIMKSELASDIRRSGMASDIAACISRAIKFYQREKFWFNVGTAIEFSTIAGQSIYDADDDVDLAKVYAIDLVTAADSSDETAVEWMYGIPLLEETLTSGSSRNRPYAYGRVADKFILFPPPDKVYTISIVGHWKVAEPSDDNETANPWMVEASELIRYRAKSLIYEILRNDVEIAKASARETQIYEALISETDDRTSTGFLQPTEF